MKILILSKGYPPTVGGVENYSQIIAEGLANSLNVNVLTFNESNFSDNKIDNRVKVKRLFKTKFEAFNAVIFFIALLRTIFSQKPAIVLATTWKIGLPYALLSFFIRIPFIVTAHGAEITRHQDSKILLKFMRLTFSKANAITAVSNFTAYKLKEYINLNHTKINVIWNGVEEKTIPESDQEQAREKIGFKKAEKLLLTVSRLDNRKGHDVVIQCLPEIIKVHPSVKYVIVGTGPTKEKLSKLAKQLDLLNKHVFFIGYVSDEVLQYYYQATDIFIMLNQMKDDKDFEGFGLVFAEAGLFSKMCIAGDNGGPSEVIIDNVTGYLINPEEKLNVINTINEIFLDHEKIIMMGKKNNERTINNFTRKIMIQKFITLIEKTT